MGTDVEKVREELSEAPNAAIAQKMRDHMAEVTKVAKISKNLKGNLVKALKQAAVYGAATADMLRTRADKNEGPDGGDATRKIEAMRRELERERREAREREERATAEISRLRRELEEAKGGGRTRGGRVNRIRDSSPSPSPLRPTRGPPPKTGRRARRRRRNGWTWK